MRYFYAPTADLAWQKAADEIVCHPDYRPNGIKGSTQEILSFILRIEKPQQRWIVSRFPPYNPAFGLVEFVWIITGNNHSLLPNYWNPSLPKYAGGEQKYHGAYGFRLRNEFGIDQLRRGYEVLSSLPESRQVVLQIWKPEIDLPKADGQPVSKDIPCNVMSLLKLREGRLYWSQIMRSNDVIRGLPYNIIQFTMLQEVMAAWLGVKLGDYIHFADSLHLYQKDLSTFKSIPMTQKTSKIAPFSLSYQESSVQFEAIYDDLLKVAEGNLSEKQLSDTFMPDSEKNKTKCVFLQDILAVIGSDAARREGYIILAQDLAQACVNINLKFAMINWLKYREEMR